MASNRQTLWQSSGKVLGLGLMALVLFGPLALWAATIQEQKDEEGTALTLWDGKDPFGWKAPEGTTGPLGQGGMWIHGTTFGPSHIDFKFGEVEPSAQMQVVILGKDDSGPPVNTFTLSPGNAGAVSTMDIVSDGFRIGLKTKNLNLASVKLTPRKMKPLFNGKDLEGWSVFPGKKTDFTWSKDGVLSVKNGPGDLQTKETFDHFVAQVDIKTNGKHLNSGIFFKGLPDQYWKGYEAQIRNQFNEKADQKYTVDIYDPKTNAVKSKETVMSKAVDYGTGAIYRRLPTRLQASKDGEWFTMTIAVKDRHIATWVNGVQTVDWTDNRPANENPREGYREKPGIFSIQGHDPTTDIDFKNFRVTKLSP